MRVESRTLAVCVTNEKDKIRLLFVPTGDKINLILNGPRGGFKGSVLVTLNELQRVIQALTAKMAKF